MKTVLFNINFYPNKSKTEVSDYYLTDLSWVDL